MSYVLGGQSCSAREWYLLVESKIKNSELQGKFNWDSP